jgi:hypothetical protein
MHPAPTCGFDGCIAVDHLDLAPNTPGGPATSQQKAMAYLVSTTKPHRGGHLTTTSPLNAKEMAWKELWGPVPHGTTLQRTCEHEGCYAPEHHKLVSTDTIELRLAAYSTVTEDGHILGPNTLRVGGSTIETRRIAWGQKHGPIPRTHYLERTCDDQSCIATDHHKLTPIKAQQ